MADQATVRASRAWIVPRERPPLRLDAFARECLPHLSRRQIESAIRAKLFFIGGKAASKGDRLAGGDELRFQGPSAWLAESPLPQAEISLPVIYEDEAILAVNKPAGVATHGFSGRDTDTLANLLLAHRPELANIGRSRWEPGIVHRLDRETSGVLLAAKTQSAFEDLRAQFRRRQVQKIYWAMVHGKTPTEGVITMPLAHERGDARRMRAVTGAPRDGERVWKATTRYRRLAHQRKVSLLEIAMETGVTHQIRVHCAAIGHPMIADALYGDGQAPDFGLRRHFLHARSLTLLHPKNGQPVTMTAELPGDLAELLERLRIRV